jgi:hypothetical protein
MNAITFLRSMHADAKQQFKSILACDDFAQAERMWQQLQPILDVHEQLEDTLVYSPLATDMGPGTPLGDWAQRHDGEVAVVKELIAAVNAADGGTPRWQMAVARVSDALNYHVQNEEGQIFGRVEQAWDSERLESVGAEMQARFAEATGEQVTATRARQRRPATAGSGKRR